MAQQSNRFVPSLESLGERVNLSPAAPVGQTVTFTFTLGSLPAGHVDLYMNIWINQSELPSATRELRHRVPWFDEDLSGAGVTEAGPNRPNRFFAQIDFNAQGDRLPVITVLADQRDF